MTQGTNGTKAVSERLATRLAEVAAELRREIYGDAGFPQWGTKFVEIEATVLDVGHALARQMAEQTLAEQARTAAQCVPDIAQAATNTPDPFSGPT